ncbi:FAD-binding oxidoreductase [Lentibacillus jeotgali]|uniref:FAD-binding oxidoreductase n=1 Tax=Lentibacillus jeotgali TaxID=558169 RepID=UPI000262686B|nr:FAD-binding oxidoreductase [Lentibacillus jeotgali]
MSTSIIEAVVPKDQIKQNESDHPLGNGARQTIEARSEDDIANVLRYANDHNRTVNIISGGTKRGYGGTIKEADILLSLAHYKGIVEHSVGDLTLTVRPGTTIKEISDQLAESGQCLALDPSWPELATIGGVISANESGPKRLLYGSARDHVIGTRIVYADGRVIRTGGKVVKNVAGYDMNKLFIGAMGTLGVISEITLKLRPLPKYEALSLLHFPDGYEQAIHDFAKRILDSMMEPVSLEVLTPAMAEKLTGKRLDTLAIAFEDQEKAVIQQEKWVTEHLPPDVEQTVLHEQEAVEWWEAFRRQGPNGHNDGADDPKTQAALKIGSLPSDVPGNLKKAEELAETHHVSVEAHGGAGHGISRVYINGYAEDVITLIKALRSEAEKKHGYVVCTHLPFALREEADVWGEKPAYFPLLDGVKRANDPKKRLNRQRFVGGI